MKNKFTSTVLITFVLLMSVCMNICAQSESPVRIEFDNESQRIDIVTGQKLPEYTNAQKGSFQFFFSRLDKPDDFIWYFFDGRRLQNIDDLAFIRKMKSAGAWIIALKSNNSEITSAHPKTTCEIQHDAVSFIPINPITKQPDKRVYVLLDDLHLIQWADYDSWLATDSQKEVESKAGTVY